MQLRQRMPRLDELRHAIFPARRLDEEVAVDAAQAAHRVMDIFAAADLSDPVMAALFDQVLGYRSA